MIQELVEQSKPPEAGERVVLQFPTKDVWRFTGPEHFAIVYINHTVGHAGQTGERPDTDYFVHPNGDLIRQERWIGPDDKPILERGLRIEHIGTNATLEDDPGDLKDGDAPENGTSTLSYEPVKPVPSLNVSQRHSSRRI